MIKKTVLSSIIFLSASSVIYAKTTSYVGGGLGVGGYGQQSGLNGASANIFAGKGNYIDKDEKIYVGGELGAGYTYQSGHNNAFGLSASIMPGLMITNSTMLYGRLGVATSYIHKKSMAFGPQYGVGLQTNVAKNWDVRTEYTSFVAANHSSQIGAGLVYKFD